MVLTVSGGSLNGEAELRWSRLQRTPTSFAKGFVSRLGAVACLQAHNALTDETAKANYEKCARMFFCIMHDKFFRYGNPDGPQTSKVGIGLPGPLQEKQEGRAGGLFHMPEQATLSAGKGESPGLLCMFLHR